VAEIEQISPAAPSSQVAELAGRVDDFAKARVLCIGDIMLDRFIYGSVERISPEAPIPVFSMESEDLMLGGAGNVVRNIVSLGAEACFLSVVGDDAVGKQLLGLIGEEDNVEPYVLSEKDRISTKKTRYIAGNQQLLRSDKETRAAITEASESQLMDIAKDVIPKFDIIILSDYGKGTLSPQLIRRIIDTAKEHNKKVIVDPKSRDFGLYAGAYLVSPNLSELANASGRDHFDNDVEIVEAAHALLKEHTLEHVLVTRGKDGMTLVYKNGESLHIPARAKEVFDVSGAGDTAIATLAVAHASGLDLADAALSANVAAGIVVGKLGTAVVYRTDLKTALYTHDTMAGQSKVLPQNLAADAVANWQRQGLKVGFTNGCFDIMHAGHVQLLQDARAECDRLVVGLNSDDSVKRLKGESRPVNAEMDRAMLLAALHVVDLVVIFREDTPLRLLEDLRPDVLMKGADYTKETVVGAELVESYGGEIVLLPLKEGYSTTNTIAKLS